MSRFNNGPKIMGLSLADRMRAAVAAGMDEREAVDRVLAQVATRRISKKRLAELYRDLKTEPTAQGETET